MLFRMKNTTLKLDIAFLSFINNILWINKIHINEWNTCFPIGSGFVIVVLKKPSHSNRPYKPAQWLCLLPVCGKHQGIRVLNCLSKGSQGSPVAHWQTPRNAPFLARPFLISSWVYCLFCKKQKKKQMHQKELNMGKTTHKK